MDKRRGGRLRSPLRSTLVAAVSVKIILAALTPLSYDFAGVLGQVLRNSPDVKFSLWRILQERLLALWFSLPVEKTGIVETLNFPPFQVGPTHFLLALFMKSPIIALDLLLGLMIYRIALKLTGDKSKSTWAIVLWLANPYVTFTAEMWGGSDILPTFLLTLSVLLIVSLRPILSAAAYAGSIAVKLFPVLVLPVMLTSSYRALGRSKVAAASLMAAGAVGVSLYFGWLALSGENLLLSMLQYHPLTYAFDEFTISGFGIKIGLATVSIVLFGLAFHEYARPERMMLVNGIAGILLFYTIFTNLRPPHLLLLIPFLTLDVALNGRRLIYMVGLLGSAFIFFLFSFAPLLTTSGHSLFFIPSSTLGLLDLSRSLFQLRSDPVVKEFLEPLTRAAFTAVGLLYGSEIFLSTMRPARSEQKQR